jgi:hypothetical protein
LNRPELSGAVKDGTGSAIRYSKTLKSDYLYFAKKYPRYVYQSSTGVQNICFACNKE